MSVPAEPRPLAGLAAIVAVARNGVIGREGDLPWRLREDLRRFRRLTMGHALVMGRRTWESIGRPLPGRRSHVLSRGGLVLPEDVGHLHGLQDVLELVRRERATVFCIGGADVYRLLLPWSSELFLTRVEADVAGDARFEPPDLAGWDLLEEERLAADEHNEWPTTFLHYARGGAGPGEP